MLRLLAFILTASLFAPLASSQDEARELSMEERALLQLLEGKWRCMTLVLEGRTVVTNKDLTSRGAEVEPLSLEMVCVL